MTKVIHRLAAVTLGVLIAGATLEAAAVEISLRAEAQLDRSVVRLGDVADVVASDSCRGRKLAELILMPAPAPGTERFLSRREVQDLLAAHGEDVNQVRFVGNDRVAVVAAAASAEQAGDGDISREASRRSALSRESASSKLPTQPSSKQIQQLHGEIERLILEHVSAQSGQSSAWRITMEIAERHLRQLMIATTPPVCKGGGAPWIGPQRFVICFATAEGEISVPVYADIALPAPVVVATRAIQRGATITAADLELQHLNEPPAASGMHIAVASVDELIGLEAARTIQPGEVIYSDQARAPIVINRGEEVAVTAQGGGIRVRTTARARQDGARGDLIEVETLTTKERFDVRVTAPGQAAVFSTARPQVARQRKGAVQR